jgi:hypothetical protein
MVCEFEAWDGAIVKLSLSVNVRGLLSPTRCLSAMTPICERAHLKPVQYQIPGKRLPDRVECPGRCSQSVTPFYRATRIIGNDC